MATALKTPTGWPTILLERAGDDRPARPRRGDRARAPSRACARRSATSGRPRRSPRSPPPACAVAAAPASRPARSGAPRPTTEAPRRYVVANGYGADPASGTDRTCWSTTRTRVIEGAGHRGLRDRRGRGDHRGPRRGRRGHPPARGRDRRGRGRRVHRRRTRFGRAARPVGRGPAGPGRLHARRGDRAAEGPRGQARPARAAAAASRRARPVGRCRRSSTTSRRSPPSAGSCATAPEAFAATGSKASPGTILVQVADAVGRRASPRCRSGRRCARSSSSAARCPAGRSIKAVLVGGPSGGLLPPDGARHRRTTSSRCARPAPTSARARSSSPTIAPASSTWPGC